MARNKRPSKQYRPRAKNGMAQMTLLAIKQREADMAAMYFVPLTADEQRDTLIIYGTAFDLLVNGRGAVDDAQRLADMCNTATVLCERGFGLEFVDDTTRGLDGVFRAGLRFQVTGVWELDDVARAAVSRVYDIFCGQIQIAGQGHLLDAEREVMRRCNEGNYYRAERVALVQPETTEPNTEAVQ